MASYIFSWKINNQPIGIKVFDRINDDKMNERKDKKNNSQKCIVLINLLEMDLSIVLMAQ